MQQIKHLWLLLLLLLNGRLLAGDETRSSRAYASQIVSGAFVQTHDDKYGTVGPTIYRNRGVVELGLDEDMHVIMNGKTICVKFDVEVTNATGITTLYTNQQLSINYNPFQQTRYKDKAQLVYPDAHVIKVTGIVFKTCALGINCASCSTPYSGNDAYIQAEITTSRIYNFNFTDFIPSAGISHTLDGTAQELEIAWDYIPGAEDYELEYTYIDDYTATLNTYLPASGLTYDFEHDATRISTTAKSYRIPLTYENGYIIYRIRPIGRSALNERMEGAWNGAAASGLVSGTTYAAAVTRLQNDALNWQSVKTFAENGRTGTGLSYSDALGYSRQSLARLNTDQKTIAQSTLYDFYGRPAIHMLPSPVNGRDLNYRFGLNLYRATPANAPREFEKYVFDSITPASVCDADGITLDPGASAGAANYYSPQNPYKEAFQGYVPDADSLPYTQAKFRADGLGRVTMQSMPGPAHQLGSGREVKYYYSKPTQVELDRLFGKEAPRAIHCYKNYVLDPNGQMSTTYIDQYGRTMATALLGNNPYSVDSLANLPTSQIFSDTLHMAPTNHKDTSGFCVEVNTTFFIVDNNTPQNFFYATTLGQFGSACTPTLCYDCVYNLEISIRNDCGEEVFDFDGSNLTPPGYDSVVPPLPYLAKACGGPLTRQITGAVLNSPVTINFQKAGTYSLYKKICVSEAPLEAYTRDFINNQTCGDPCYYIDSLIAATDFSGCGTQSCADCYASIATYTALADSKKAEYDREGNPIDTNYTGPVYPEPTPQQLSGWLENCSQLCGPGDVCESYRRALLADFWPVTGQYAETDPASPRWNGSIMNTGNALFSGYHWADPTGYVSANGAPAYVQINGITATPQSLGQADYVLHYRKSWAEAFLSRHPEYCKLYFHCTVTGATQDYDARLKSTAHYDTICDHAGLIFPLGTLPGTIVAPPDAGCAGPDADPIFTSLSGNALVIAFKNELLTNLYGSGQSIYEYVASQFYSPIPGGYSFGQDECNRDLMWDMFRNIYTTKKYALYEALFTAYQANPSSFGYSGGACPVSFPSDYTSHFPNWRDSIDAHMPGSPATSTLVNDMIANNNPASAISFSLNLQAANSATIATACASTCAGYLPLWHLNLNAACPAYGSAPTLVQNDILAALQGVCELGCDINNPNGASSTPGGSSYVITGTVTAQSFQDVLNYYLGNNACAAGIITLPAPYPFAMSGGSPAKPSGLSSCQCDQLLKVSADFAVMQGLNTLPAGVEQEWQLFRKLYGYDIKDYYTLKCVCNAAVAADPGNTPWAPGLVWTPPQTATLAVYNGPIPSRLKCSSCISCGDVVSAINNMTLPSVNAFSGRIAAIKNDSMNTYYVLTLLNAQFGKHSLKFYADLYNDCQTFNSADADTAGTFANNITNEAVDLFHYMNQLTESGLLQKNNRALSLCQDDKYYLSGLYGDTLPTFKNLTYKYSTSGSSLTFTIQNSSPANLLVVTLTLPVGYAGTWAGLLYLHDLVAWCPSPAAGANYSFKVGATDASFNEITLTGQVTNNAFPISYLGQSGSPEPAVCPQTPKTKNSCAITLINNALTQGRMLFDQHLNELVATFQYEYRQHCFGAIREKFYRNYKFVREYNYTLYYYDEAGNLQRTVAPKGVVPVAITTNMTPGTAVYPQHSSFANGVDKQYVSDYQFNAYNTPTKESTIDGGTTHYLYDPIGRILASQNAKQAGVSGGTTHVFSYTLYDMMGRITEVGEMTVSSNLLASGSSMAYAGFTTAVAGATKKQVVNTYYDDFANVPASANATAYFALSGHALANLRNRVACTMSSEDPSATGYQHASYYSYDDHGNVATVVQENRTLPNALSGGPGYSMQFKRTGYSYDLVSGNMLLAEYQHGQADRFIHRYHYDDDNRLHEVFTSKDSLNWDRDAKYFYYQHGPLARIERADKQVQGMDYYYTIHGWLKGINSDAMQPGNDAGKDGAATNAYLSNYNRIHAWFAKDAMAFALNYYNNATPTAKNMDYSAIKAGTYGNTLANQPPSSSFANLYGTNPSFYLDNGGLGDAPSLYNGNISSMVTGFLDKYAGNTITDNQPFVQLTGYRYDQLHRITAQKAHRSRNGNSWNAAVGGTNYDDSYRMNLSYDDNGNILSLFRNGSAPALNPGAMLAMDNFTYTYKTIANGASVNSNLLYGLFDGVTATNYADDADGPGTTAAYTGSDRYTYDAIGNLQHDAGEYIDTIQWTVDRKVKAVIRNAPAMISAGVNRPDIEYEYNALRQRVTKIVKPRDPVTRALLPDTAWRYTYYVYDAGGNVMAVYDRHVFYNGSNYTDAIDLAEHDLYGSSRLALTRPVSQLRWSYNFSLCGIPGGVNNCRTAAPGSSTYPGLPAISPYYSTGRWLGYKEFELNNQLGNVIATVSDRKIILTGCPNEFLRDFTPGGVGSLGMWPVNMTEVITGGGQLRLTPTGANASTSFTYGITADDLVRIGFDLQMGSSTAADSLRAEVYPYDSTTHTIGPRYNQLKIREDGSYQLDFTGPPAGSGYNSLYVLISTQTPTTDLHYFYLDNIAIARGIGGAPNTAPCSSYVQQFLGYFPDLLMHTDYYAFGQQMPGRTWTASDYRYGFNGHEHDNEVFEGANGTFYRIYDSRIGRWFSKDPYTFPDESPYAAMGGNPIAYSDPLGDKITYGSIKDWARTQFKRLTDKEFRKEFKALKEEYSGEFIDENGKGTGREKELHIITGGKKYGTLDEAVSNHSITHGKANDGQDYLRYNGNIDKIAISEQRSGIAYIGGNRELMVPPDMKTYNFHYYLRASASLGSEFNWKISTSYIDNGLFANGTFSSPKNSIQTYLNISLQNINKNVEGGDGDPRTGRAPTYSSDHVLGWNSAMVIYKIEAMGLPKIYTVERRIFGGYRNKKVLSDYSGRIDKILKKSMSISVQKVD